MAELTVDQALQQGIDAHKAGQMQEADRIYTAILKVQPKHPYTNHNMGVLAVGVGKVEQALPFFKIALAANPTTAQFWLSYIDTLIKLERLADAQTVFDRAKSKGAKGDGFDQLEQRLNNPKGVPVEAVVGSQETGQVQTNILDAIKLDQAFSLAKTKAKEGVPEEAKLIYQDVLAKFPKNKRAINGLKGLSGKSVGKLLQAEGPPQDQLQTLINLYSQGQLKQALEQATLLLQQFPSSSVLYNIRGAVYQGLGQLDASVQAYNKALAIKPDYAEAYYNMGNALKDQGKLVMTIEAYNKALALKPDYADCYLNKGVALQAQGKLEEATGAYSQALTIKPDCATAYNNMGSVLQDQGKLEEAIESYNKALAIKPDYAEAYNNMGVTLQEQGKLEEAIESYNKALAIKPDDAEIFSNMGNVLKEQGKLEKAIEAYNKALAIKPDYAEAYNNMGNVLKDQWKVKKAIDAYNKALAIKPDYAEAETNLAVLLFDRGSFEEAAELFSKNNSSKNQTYLLKCLYRLDEQSKFYNKLDYLIERGENNCVIGSFTSRAEIRYGIKKNNPFCNDPFKYVFKADLTKECDFKQIFVEKVTNVLRNDDVNHRSQSHLTNGIQTAGNIFTQVGSVTNLWQNIIHSELKKYKDHFCKSEEGVIRGWPADYSIYGWLVSMKSGGELSAHIHDTGWITGSIYINVPPKTKKDSGNLILTTDDTKPEKDKNKNSQSIDVVTGSLCLFPSSLLHYTIPFEADENRIVLAFDMIPK